MGIHVTDEMLARYLSGKATPEEESVVLDYLSENDERVEDLLAMSAAIETCSTGVEESKSQKVEESKGRRVRPLWPALSAAASVAILIGVGVALFHHHQAGSAVAVDPAPAYAEQDTMDTVMSYEL